MTTASVMKELSANPTKWSNTLKQFVGNLPTNCLSVFDHFVGLAFKGLRFFQATTNCLSEFDHFVGLALKRLKTL